MAYIVQLKWIAIRSTQTSTRPQTAWHPAPHIPRMTLISPQFRTPQQKIEEIPHFHRIFLKKPGIVEQGNTFRAIAARGARLGVAPPLEAHRSDLFGHLGEAVVTPREAHWVDLQEPSCVAGDVAVGDRGARAAVRVADAAEGHVVVAGGEEALIDHKLGGLEKQGAVEVIVEEVPLVVAL